jgi:hypothetical protein
MIVTKTEVSPIHLQRDLLFYEESFKITQDVKKRYLNSLFVETYFQKEEI